MSGPYSHTPGPWAWRDSALVPASPDPDKHSVHTIMLDGQCYGFLGSDNKSVLAEDAANRTLIAAAPAMLAALRKAQRWFCEPHGCLSDSELEEARAFLAQSTESSDREDVEFYRMTIENHEIAAAIDAAIAQAEGLQ